ncbi:hypothetical protein [Microbacterium sp. SORGH_AS_0421]|uniref:hypothetical protein n=1 Tax=Microbacterium sp. SORGH_AS_0421 TaxID=3041768 RepID=UPI0027929952|nr:hypothetical protein [Microbacterium sp. SORGH_AS_0421]MDQ1177270.1 hypothetical protein [Microbacterium sp. SORGH_AS_0421]
MPEPYEISSLADSAIGDLTRILKTGTTEQVVAWAEKYSWNDRRRDTGVLTALAQTAADMPVVTSVPQASEEWTLCRQLMATYRNDDRATFEALVRSWVKWPPTARTEVLLLLIRYIVENQPPKR